MDDVEIPLVLGNLLTGIVNVVKVDDDGRFVVINVGLPVVMIVVDGDGRLVVGNVVDAATIMPGVNVVRS